MAINVSDLPPKYQAQAMKKYMEQQKQRQYGCVSSKRHKDLSHKIEAALIQIYSAHIFSFLPHNRNLQDTAHTKEIDPKHQHTRQHSKQIEPALSPAFFPHKIRQNHSTHGHRYGHHG